MFNKKSIEKQEQVLLNNNARKLRAGEFYSINTMRAQGHKGQLRNIKKNGTATGVIVTHAPYTRGRKNIQLCENPQGENRTAFVVTEPEEVNIKKNVGKHHSNLKICNAVDKAKMRNIAKRPTKKKR